MIAKRNSVGTMRDQKQHMQSNGQRGVPPPRPRPSAWALYTLYPDWLSKRCTFALIGSTLMLGSYSSPKMGSRSIRGLAAAAASASAASRASSSSRARRFASRAAFLPGRLAKMSSSPSAFCFAFLLGFGGSQGGQIDAAASTAAKSLRFFFNFGRPSARAAGAAVALEGAAGSGVGDGAAFFFFFFFFFDATSGMAPPLPKSIGKGTGRRGAVTDCRLQPSLCPRRRPKLCGHAAFSRPRAAWR